MSEDILNPIGVPVTARVMAWFGVVLLLPPLNLYYSFSFSVFSLLWNKYLTLRWLH